MTLLSDNFPIGENHPDPIFLFSVEESQLQWMNSAAESWLQKPIMAMAGRLVAELGKGFEELSNRMELGDQTATSYRGYDLVVNVRRTDYICQYKIFGTSAGIAVHITPKELGTGLVQASGPEQSVTMLGKMLAHELKNPLAGIRGAAQLLEADLTEADDIELTGLITTEVDRIGRLADRMEKFGQAEFDKFTHFNVHEVLRKATLLFENQNSGDLEFIEIFDPSLPDVFGDVDSIMQVVVNLIANAVDAIRSGKSGGTIKVQTKYRTGIHRRDHSGRKRTLPVEVVICDSGPGIPENLRDRIFQPFVTSKANGQGLGLALISKIIEDHGGLIEMSSEPGKTVFSFMLPVNSNTESRTSP
jgi:two-component system nitrogen regulation sensor histidine kinase GlnL